MQPSSTDPYDILGLPSSATPADIKLAFRKKASVFHPDRNPDPNAPARFREAQEAYDLLIDEDRRRAHDQKRQRRLLEDPSDAARAMFTTYLAEFE
jgi:curved DNA-binding protein CbpA